MQIEQNLFSIYRLILKTPKYIFILSLGFLLVIAAIQLQSIFTSPPPLDVSQCLLDYVLEKHAQGVNSTSGTNTTESTTNKSEQAKLDEYELVGDTTVLNVQLGSDCHYQIDYEYKFDKQHLPVMFLTKNEYLAYLQDRPQSYLKKHKISHDRLTVPDPRISTPLLAYFYHQDMSLNQLLVESFIQSVISLDSKFLLYARGQNMTNSKLALKELYLTFYYKYGALSHQRTINMVQFLSLKFVNTIFLKLIYGFGLVLIVYLVSMFVGLAIRYSLFLLYTIFLLGYDRCMGQSWGWVHQNLSILYSRFRQSRGTTLKFLLFYVLANIGIYGLLTIGSYCIIKKLYYPLMPFLFEQQTQFFFKSMFFVELFLYLMCRSRTSLQFFPILSFLANYLCLFLMSVQSNLNVTLLLNLNLTLQLILFSVFILIEQAIQSDNQKGMIGEYCPSLNKPRMLFYAGYDISWEKSLPPIWTYFTSWFDYSYFNEAEKSLIAKDYQLLYGRMLGLNERQEIPEYQHEEQSERMGLREQPSNQMNLIQNDL